MYQSMRMAYLKLNKMLLFSSLLVSILITLTLTISTTLVLAESKLLSLRHLNPSATIEHRWSRELSNKHQQENNLIPVADLYEQTISKQQQQQNLLLENGQPASTTLSPRVPTETTTTTTTTSTITTTTTPSPSPMLQNVAGNEVSDNQLPTVSPSTDQSSARQQSPQQDHQQQQAVANLQNQDLDNNIQLPAASTSIMSSHNHNHIHSWPPSKSSKQSGRNQAIDLQNRQHSDSSLGHHSNNTITGGVHSSKKGSSAQHGLNLNKLLKHLNEKQQDLVKRNPGSLMAVARALKMAIVECQYQMRHELWDCPIISIGVRPVDIFGKLMTRSFKETSFVRSLLSAAIVHSVARACTESMITTCGRMRTRDGGYGEDIDFGRRFAREFMTATLELPPTYGSAVQIATSGGDSMTAPSLARSLNMNNFATGNEDDVTSQQQQQKLLLQQSQQLQLQQNQLNANSVMEPTRREKNIRNLINAHNDEVGQLHVLNGMRRECKCHGISGACNTHTCWLRLPSLREVAIKLHAGLHDSIRVIYVAHTPASRPKSLTSGSAKKSNKKRSSSTTIPSSSRQQSSNLLTRSSATMINLQQQYYNPYDSSNSLTGGTINIVGSRRRGSKRHTTGGGGEGNNFEDSHRAPAPVADALTSGKGPADAAVTNLQEDRMSNDEQAVSSSTPIPRDMISDPMSIHQPSSLSMGNRNASSTQRRPIARSIGITASTISPSKTDLLYYEDSPDFCIPSEIYNIRGTKSRMCSVNPNESNNCEKLCCGRGYRTEVREEKYKCECQFQFCCKLNCNTCTRRKVLHKCI